MSRMGKDIPSIRAACGIVSVNTCRPSSSWFVVVIAVPFLRRPEALLPTGEWRQNALGGAQADRSGPGRTGLSRKNQLRDRCSWFGHLE
jgi:hypothetical protein